MSVDVRSATCDLATDLRTLPTNQEADEMQHGIEQQMQDIHGQMQGLQQIQAAIGRIESRPLNLTQFKRNGRKRRTPQKSTPTHASDSYHSDSSHERSPPPSHSPLAPPSHSPLAPSSHSPLAPPVDDEEKASSILEHYRSFMQRKSLDTNGFDAILQRPKKQKLSKSMSANDGGSLLSWHNFSTNQSAAESESMRSSPSFSDGALSGLIPERTMRQNNWAIKVWRDWALTRNRNPDTKLEKYQEVPVDIRVADIDVMSYWLPKFIKEVRRKDKKAYPADTLMQIASGLQRYLRQVSCRSEVNFFDKYSNTFAEFREALKSRSGELSMESHTHRGKKVSVENLNDDELWQSGFFNLGTAKGLFHSVFYYNCVEFEVTSMEEHHELKVEQFTLGFHKEKQAEYLEFCRGEQRYYNMSTKRVMRIYANHEDNKCLVKLYKTYLDLIPSIGPFYRRPLQTSDHSLPRFSFNPVGINKLRETFKQLFSSDRPASMRKSGKATIIQQMSPQSNSDFDSRVPPSLGMSQSATSNVSQALYDAITQKLINGGHLKVNSSPGHKMHETNTSSDYDCVTSAPAPVLNASDVMERLRKSWHDVTSRSDVTHDVMSNGGDVDSGEEKVDNVDDDAVITLNVPRSVKSLVVERGGRKYKFDLE